jgi:3-dehydroquinate dehydratase
VVSPVVTGSIVGFGGTGYRLAVAAIAEKLAG